MQLEKPPLSPLLNKKNLRDIKSLRFPMLSLCSKALIKKRQNTFTYPASINMYFNFNLQ